MIYISPQNEYPRHAGDIMLAHPSWQVGDPLPEGWVEVAQSVPPIANQDQVLYESAPEKVNGVITQSWKVRKMTDSEIERRDAPATAKQKLLALGLTELEIHALAKGIVR